ncbi:hypothetical protein B0H19DRAFT_188763 [Mycena capillaripes]|nr:hypothetical protein B0H19DRAFT_188763 [Mycena capillaripes]
MLQTDPDFMRQVLLSPTTMSRARDGADPPPLRQSSRSHLPSHKLADLNNAEPLDAVHQALVTKSIAAIISLIDEVEALCPTLPKSVPKAPRNGEIWRILNKVKGQETTGPGANTSTFVRRMDLLFGANVRDADGRMIYVQRGDLGIPLVLQYFRKINWQSDGIPLAPATLKLTQVLKEMRYLCANLPGDIPNSPDMTPAPTAAAPNRKRSAGDALSDEEFLPRKKIIRTHDGSPQE